MEGHGDGLRSGNGHGLDFSALGQHLSQQQQDPSLGFCPGTHFPQQINPALDSANVFPSILAVAGGCSPPSSLYPSISTPHNILVEPLQGAGGVLSWAAPTQTLYTALLSIQQRIHQIQALVQLMMGVGVGVGVGGIGGGGGHSQFAPSIASLISELVVTATGMLQQFSVSLPQVIAGDLHLHSPSLSLPFAEQGFFPAAELLRMGNYSSSSSSPFFNGPNLGSTSCSFPDDGLDDPSARLLNVGNPSRVNGGRRKGEGYGNRDVNRDGDHGLRDGHRDGDHVLGDRNRDGDQVLGDGIGDGNHGFGDGDRRWDPESDEEEEAAGSYELIEMAEFEILAEHTHFCSVCGKGFKRDANLRMHMRGHGDEYKTPAALARPAPPPPPPGPVPLEGSSTGGPQLRPRRYSCPSDGCKRNKRHRKFRPLKTLLCVKNHYRRSHCPKVLICAKCGNKRFSVLADLKTHEKHCGRDKWQCSCGTTFSRKDKLFGHVSLFSAGHFPDPPIPTNTTTTTTTTIHPPLSPPPALNPSFPIPNAAPSTFHDFPPALFHHNSNPFQPKLLSHCDELTPDLFVHHPK